MYTLLADRLEQAERKRQFWPRLLDRVAKVCECAVYALLILLGHVLAIRWITGG